MEQTTSVQNLWRVWVDTRRRAGPVGHPGQLRGPGVRGDGHGAGPGRGNPGDAGGGDPEQYTGMQYRYQ